MKPEHNLDHVRHDTGHVLAPGLFRSLKKGDYKKLKLDVVYEYGRGERLEFKAAEPLGAPELRVLQGLIAMAGPNGMLLSTEPKTPEGQELRLLLEMKFDAIRDNAIIANGSYRALAKEIGYADIENTKNLQTIIERLWGVSVIAQNNGERRGFRLLSTYGSNLVAGNLNVALNPRIANAILGEVKHCRIDMSEVRALKTDPARLIHQRMCGWINAGSSGRVGLDALCEYVWPDPAQPNTMKKRRSTLKKALTELELLAGWKVSEYVKQKFEISRPKIPC